MFASRLACEQCEYRSPAFEDGLSLFNETYDLVFQRLDTKEIVVREVPAAVLSEKSIDRGKRDGQVLIQLHLAQSGEQYIHLPLSEFDLEIALECPRCGSPSLFKRFAGMT